MDGRLLTQGDNIVLPDCYIQYLMQLIHTIELYKKSIRFVCGSAKNAEIFRNALRITTMNVA